MYFPCVTANEKSLFQVITFRRNTNAKSRPGAGKELAKPLTVLVVLLSNNPWPPNILFQLINCSFYFSFLGGYEILSD